MWEYLDLVRVYTKKKGNPPDFENPFIMRGGGTVEQVCLRIHKDMLNKFRYALVWGTSAKHASQCVGKEHVLDDEDVIQIVVKTGNQLESDRYKLEKEMKSVVKK
eukprot:TRINITY_DN15912_c0_g1_i2.p1 TRINITY_DN15912_c0_g1~~TRINITY_DN15912_c0_g1_i2.p1  ORF type:complete len:105 (+),score=23.11 TRINITY_DN15912_c0_g1_i2:394-708(+)